MYDKIVEFIRKYCTDFSSRCSLMKDIKGLIMDDVTEAGLLFIKDSVRDLYTPSNVFNVNFVLSTILSNSMDFDNMYDNMCLFHTL